MRAYACAICLTVLSAPAAAQDALSFEVTQAGIYAPYVVRSKRDASGVIQNMVLEPKLAKATTIIPARIGISFGFRYRVGGKPPGKTIVVRKETHYPAPGAKPPGSKAVLTVNSVQTNVRLNNVLFSGYTLAEPWELIPGKWVFSFWLGDRKLGEQEFTIVAQ